jgi:hypothetical protein
MRTFDPRVFSSQDADTQRLCSLVLALAAFYNDWKDLYVASAICLKSKPGTPQTESTEWGEFNGLIWHLLRLRVGHVRELIVLVEENAAVLNSPRFDTITKALAAPHRRAWRDMQALVGAAPTSQLARFCMLVRNKVAFHYDPKPLFRGYSDWFLAENGDRRPLMSAGTSVNNTRFYFAEAAAESYFEELLASLKCSPQELLEFCDAIGLAVGGVVKEFVRRRSAELNRRDNEVQ